MKTVIVLVVLAFGGRSYSHPQNLGDVTAPAQTIPVEIQQVPQQQFSFGPSETTTDASSYYDYSSSLTTEGSTHYEQDAYQPSSSDFYQSSQYTSPPRSRGSARYGVSQQPRESELTYVRQQTQDFTRRRTVTPSYHTDEVPTTTQQPFRRFPQQQPNTIHDDTQSKSNSKDEETTSKRRGGRRHPDADAYIVRYSNENNVQKGYKFGYETSNNMMRNEELVFEDPDHADQPTIYGGYEFTDPAGGRVVVTYTAGIFGFKPIIKYIKP
ncbi:hypothetical protein PPYR_08753 [Photinus pyralis]|uniref:Uncharacterized protein n=2 Tax=Photinus pyralis TaxID=7054 RepID=A0A5N4AK94_PHOPY|nr:uncharacterized protein LOC116171482 [Photinus pyralis]KAB0797760.1 hypothetical protein PPYR_08753 [Photinus pyralis]